MTQREEAAAIVAEIVDRVGSVMVPLVDASRRLDDVLGRAQNGPPDGEADGSLTPEQWTTLRDFAEQTRGAINAIRSTQ